MAAEQRERTSNWIRRKGFVGPVSLAVLSTLACIPLLMAFARIAALPGGEGLAFPGGGWLRQFGELLNQSVSLDWVPPADRRKILYLVFLPTGAMLVAVARLTFGLRVLGLRAILISIGFQQSGVVPSLMLMAIVVAIIVAIRPWTRSIRLPMYARTAIIVGLSSAIMVGALLIAPWVRSEAVWSVAFFPVIIMAMLAEGVARTLEQGDAVLAGWRAGWTVALALFIFSIHGSLKGLLIGFPELMITQLVAVVMISEFFDLRLLEEWPDRISRWLKGARPWFTDRPKVALVRNRRRNSSVIARQGRPAPSRYDRVSVQRIIDGLRREGFQVRVVEGDGSLLKGLERFVPAHPRHGTPGGIVLNLATGIQGEGRFTHVPAMLEMGGLLYSGPSPIVHAMLSDRWALLQQLSEAGLAVPAAQLISDPSAAPELEFPLAVRPRCEPDAKRVVVRDERALSSALRRIAREYGQAAVVEQVPSGRSIRVPLVGNGDAVEPLPLVEHSASEGGKLCPAPLDEPTANRIREQARAAFLAAGCRDYARVDLVLSPFGDTTVVDVRWANLFARRGTFMESARAAGYDHGTLFRRIVTATHDRHRESRASVAGGDDGRTSVVSITDRQAKVR